MAQRTHSQIINLWPSLSDFAGDLGQGTETVRHWANRNRIPAWHWPKVAEAARKRRLGVTEAELALGMLKVNGK